MRKVAGPDITLVLGGAKSGKSSFALRKADSFSGKKAYVATAQALDQEMKERIEKHRSQRGKEWQTFEEPVDLAGALTRLGNGYNAAIVDCLTLWLSNLVLGAGEPEAAIGSFLARLKEGGFPPLFIVSNEVGMGIVPDNAVSRMFRDLAGRLNQGVAAVADEVYLVTAGIPIKIKP